MQRELERRAGKYGRAHLARAAERWTCCSSLFSKRTCTGRLHHVKLSLNRCEQRICPRCARKAAAKQVARTLEVFEQLNRAGAFARGRASNRPSFKMLTLTLGTRQDPDCPDCQLAAGACAAHLAAAVREICNAFRKLKLLVGFEKDQRDRLFGAIAASEVGPHRNVHLHVTYWGRYVPKDLLQERWKQITGDSYVVHVKELRGSWRAAVTETVKYITKLATTDVGTRSRDQEPCAPSLFLVDVLEAYRGRRRVMTYGLFYNVKVAEIEDQVCAECGEPLTYVGMYAPEHLHAFELLSYYDPPPGQEVAA